IDYNEKRMIKKQHQDGYSTPSPCSPKLHSLPIDNPFVVEEDEYGTIIIDDTSGVIFVGEVSPPSEKNNVYKNCNDLIRIGIFMKDCFDSAIDLSTDIKLLDFQCV
ncbi:11878_t:CDS:2, partial [Racocetra fulgida]